MLKREKISLNQISQISALELIKMVLNKKTNILKAFVDAVSPADKYKGKIDKEINNNSIKVKVESKVDVKYEYVSEDSIVLKFTKVHLIKKLDIQDKDCGSGYPSVLKHKNG